MAAGRQQQFLGQMRVDAPHLRAIESGVAADFDVLVGQMLAGGRPLVVSGFELVATLLTQAVSASITVAGAQIAHPLATDAGSILRVPSTRAAELLDPSANTKVVGSWSPGVNYVGIDLRRTADATTADVAQFLDANTKEENPQSIPLAKTFDYVIYVSTQDFSTTPTIAPLCKVTLDSTLKITAVEDARNLFFRLGSGGSITNSLNTYSFPGGRSEPAGVSANTTFHVGDKAIGSLKSWCDAVMTRLWDLGGGETWYGPTATHNVNLVRTGSPFVSNGQYWEWDGTNLHWQGLRLLFDNSTGYYNVITDQTTNQTSSPSLTNLADGECIYVDAVRTSNATVSAQKGVLGTLGAPLIPGSRFVLAWRVGTQVFTRNSDFYVGASFVAATTSANGMVTLSRASATPATPKVLVIEERNAANGVLGLDGNLATTVTATAGNATAVTATGNGSGAGVSATAGATGAGVIAIGGSAGKAIVARNPTTNPGPTILSQNAASKNRWSVDNLGLPSGGRISTLVEDWILTQYVSAQTLSAGASTTVNLPSTTYNANFLQFTPATAGGVTSYCLQSTPVAIIAPHQTTLTCVLEFEVGFNAAAAGTTSNTSWFFGLCASGTDPYGTFGNAPSLSKIMIQKNHNSAGYSYVTGDGTANYSNLASPATNPTVQLSPSDKIRIEIHGSATPYGAYWVFFYINGVLVGQSSATQLPTSNMKLVFGCNNEGGAPSGSPSASVGHVQMWWNRFDNPTVF